MSLEIRGNWIYKNGKAHKPVPNLDYSKLKFKRGRERGKASVRFYLTEKGYKAIGAKIDEPKN